MKILHTADWHIGKILHKHSLVQEMELFLDWLIQIMAEEEIDLLLVSGDLFDTANPSVKDRSVYYRFLSRLIGSKTQVIITGGNHDSVGLIDAPQEIFKHLKINVIGGAKPDLQDELVEVYDENQDLKLIVAAVPFLRDRDLRNLNTDEKFESRSEALKAGIEKHYATLSDLCDEQYKGIPAMAMGHLYARGVTISDSERDIHIGNAAAIESSIFPDRFSYVALGHIHRPQIIGKNPFIRYSGSPIALSFSEKEDQKCVLITELSDGKFTSPQVVFVPKNRQLKKVKGNLDEVKSKLNAYNPNFKLSSFIELEISEKDFSASILSEVEQLVSEHANSEKFTILKSKTTFENGAKDTSDLFQRGESIEDLKPLDVFDKLIENETLSEDKKEMVKDAFIELLESIHDNHPQ